MDEGRDARPISHWGLLAAVVGAVPPRRRLCAALWGCGGLEEPGHSCAEELKGKSWDSGTLQLVLELCFFKQMNKTTADSASRAKFVLTYRFQLLSTGVLGRGGSVLEMCCSCCAWLCFLTWNCFNFSFKFFGKQIWKPILYFAVWNIIVSSRS